MNASYEEWTQWPLIDVIGYADELALDAGLSDEQRLSLRESMWTQAGFGPWANQGPKPRFANFPRKPAKPNGVSVERWMREAVSANRPSERPSWDDILAEDQRRETQWIARGDGLTRHWVPKNHPLAGERRRRMQRDPFSFQSSSIYSSAHRLLWQTGHFEYNPYEGWVGPEGMNEPHVGLYWYYMRIVRWWLACRHYYQISSRTAHSRAMFCALRLGQTFTAMEIRAHHNNQFIKTQRTRDSQTAAGRASQKVSRELRRDTWWEYRRMGYTAVKAGEQAGEKLGVSERTIRRAFDDEYPKGEI